MNTATIVYQGELRTQATHLFSGTQIITDAPLDNQGKAQAFSPTDLVATALGSCMLTLMGISARNHQWNIEGTQVKITKKMGSDPRRIIGIDVIITMPADEYDSKKKQILENTARTCPVAKSIHPDIIQDVTFIYPEN